ncbi:hypothetical protein EYF80_062048 [Liparis tanakae]|uniref:Uncharacterized protein n=1 Tax=Liparis tanakae TaxID=230148 RepID=A0A4Z2EGF0_9TELE|nr:hypothetical protein EYF80_062048 [Liparis tanakae]
MKEGGAEEEGVSGFALLHAKWSLFYFSCLLHRRSVTALEKVTADSPSAASAGR